MPNFQATVHHASTASVLQALIAQLQLGVQLASVGIVPLIFLTWFTILPDLNTLMIRNLTRSPLLTLYLDLDPDLPLTEIDVSYKIAIAIDEAPLGLPPRPEHEVTHSDAGLLARIGAMMVTAPRTDDRRLLANLPSHLVHRAETTPDVRHLILSAVAEMIDRFPSRQYLLDLTLDLLSACRAEREVLCVPLWRQLPHPSDPRLKDRPPSDHPRLALGETPGTLETCVTSQDSLLQR
jgi:hypothetical protein